MKDNKNTTPNLLTCAGILMTVSGLLMVLIGRAAIGGLFWVSAALMFLAASLFAKAAKKQDKEIK